jgi:hypothetical protein
MNGETIILACMDRRLNGYVDQLMLEHPNSVSLRNAGANVLTERESLNKLITKNTERIILLPHTDCGAIKFVSSIINGGSTAPKLYSDLVQQFKGKDAITLEALEKLNLKIQSEAVMDLLGNRNIDVLSELVQTDKLSFDDTKGHALVLSRPSTTTNEDIIERINWEKKGPELGLGSTYMIQAHNLADVASDIEIAVNVLKLSDVRAFSKSSETRELESEIKKIKERYGFAKQMNAAFFTKEPKRIIR